MIWYGYMLLICLAILLHGWALFGFRDHGGFSRSAMVHRFIKSWLFCDLWGLYSSMTVPGFLKSLWFRDFLMGRLIYR